MTFSKTYVYSPRSYKRFFLRLLADGNDVLIGEETKTKEVLGARVIVRNPLDRLVLDSGRRINVAFAIAEWVSLMTGRDTASYFDKFISGYTARFSSSPERVVGAYGPRVWQNQIPQLLSRLGGDLTSRRAVLSVYNGTVDLFADSKDIPCTLNLQFLCRNGQLHAIATMRSSDAVWGLTYDLFQFTMLQEFVARRLQLQLGEFLLNAGSMHVYERHFDYGDELLNDRWTATMLPMPDDVSQHDIESLGRLLDTIDFAGSGWRADADSQLPYIRDLALTARSQRSASYGDEYEAYDAYQAIVDPTLRRALRPWLTHRGII